jgi:hypothetical protein
MPAQMMRLVGTKALIRKASGTGIPVSGWIDDSTTGASIGARCHQDEVLMPDRGARS